MSAAKAKVESVQERLNGPGYRDDPAFDGHRDLLNLAHSSTNGGAGDLQQLSQTVAHFAAVYCEDRAREPKRIADTFAELHGKACPFSGLGVEKVRAAIDAPAPAPGSFLSFSKKDGVRAGGAAAVAIGLAILLGAGVYFLNKVSTKTVDAAAKVAAKAAVEQALGAGKE